MSGRRRRGGGGGGNNNGAAANGKGSGGRSRKRRKGGKSGGGPDPYAFWGDPDKLPTEVPRVHTSADPSAVIRSLGRPPLAGNEAVAEHYFRAIYDRTVVLAGALGAAGDLTEPKPTEIEIP